MGGAARDRVVAALEVGLSRAAVGDLACMSGSLAASGTDATGGDMALAEGRVGMARAGEIGWTIGIIAVWLAGRLRAPELHTERQARRTRQAATDGIGARLAWAELSAISASHRSHPFFFLTRVSERAAVLRDCSLNSFLIPTWDAMAV